MNLKDEVVTFPKRWRPIPQPYYVVRCGDHFMVCTLDDDFNLIEEMTVIHWNKFIVRHWALDLARQNPQTRRRRG